MEPSSSSRVTVQYHDPAGVFPLISKQLQSRLPLRNLNWHSPSRPLRRIKSLHVELVAEPTGSTAGNSTKDSDGNDELNPSRRHQIPGFKTSPYLKLYLLRCDDKEQYKEASKAAVRSWVREVTDVKQRSGHDAFEWLILHVVLPNTAAASEPRWREATSKEADEPRERPKSSSKWPTKGSRTVFDRLRSDFNESKTAPDRVAQIRLSKDDISADLLPPQFGDLQTVEESKAERENAWHDLVTKLKTLILNPFDARVRQYEADIAVQESRRSMPGWNFCTFFVHKEGLARALESIGLVEDAVAVYDELNLGLETVIEDIASGAARETATSFTDVTADIRNRLLGGASVSLADEDHRRKIVNSNISVFDFFCYIFARQSTLLARLANIEGADGSPETAEKDGGEDLVLLGEICWRASNFIHNNSRTLRQDFRRQHEQAAETLINSWAYATADDILTRTGVSIFEQLVAGPKEDSSSGKAAPARQVPQRASSLAIRPRRPDVNGQLEKALPGQAELATYRAELIMIKRRAVEDTARHKGWLISWNAANGHSQVDVLVTPRLAGVLTDRSAFHEEYERLSQQAIRHYTVATQFRLTLCAKTDLAVLYGQQEEYAKAVDYLHEVHFAELGGPGHEHVLALYLRCLQKLGRNKEYAQAVLESFSKLSHEDGEDNWASQLLTELINGGGFEHEVQRPMHGILKDIEVQPKIIHHEQGCGFSLKVTFQSLFGQVFRADHISVSVVGVGNQKEEIVLTCKNTPVTVRPGLTEILVSADVISAGAFYIDQVRLQANRLKLVHHFVPPPTVPTLIIGDVDLHLDKQHEQQLRPWILLYPDEDDFDITFDLSRDIHVSRPRCLELRLEGAKQDITHIEIKLRPQAAGLRIHVGDAEVEGIDVENLAQLSLGALGSRATATVRIPYSWEDPSQASYVVLRCEAVCRTVAGSFAFTTTQRLLAELPLIIEVEDSFQVDSMVSNFSIRTSDDTPVSLESAQLKDTSRYDIEAPLASPLPALLVNSQHKANLVYRLTPKSSQSIPSGTQSSLALQVTYRRVEDMVQESVSEQFLSDLTQSSFPHLKRLLLPYLVAKLRRSNSGLEFTRAIMLRQCNVLSFDETEWSDIMNDPTVLSWLMQWHQEHSTITLRPESAIERRMTTAVDVPRPDFVHSVRVRCEANSQALQLGQRVDVFIEVFSTTVWGHGEAAAMDFVAEVHAQPDTWLVGGTKRARFTFDSTKAQRLQVSLVPLQVGLHALPTVDVQPVTALDERGAAHDPVTSMTHCASSGEMVHVIQDSQQTRVHIAGEAPLKGHVTAAIPLGA